MPVRCKGDRKFVLTDSLGRKVIRRVTAVQAQPYLDSGAWRAERDESTGVLIRYCLVSVDRAKGDVALRTRPTCAAISRREMELNLGRSRTAGMSGDAREKLAASGRAPEDDVERVQAKVRVWPHVSGGPGDILRVWPREVSH